MSKRISQLGAAATLSGAELVEVSQLSATVTITGTTISADASDNSFNDSANGFVTAGFTTGKTVKVSGFTGSVANNIVSGVVTSVAAGKIIIGGTDGDVIVTDAAGESVTITQWDSKRSTAQDVADLGGSGDWFSVKSYGATGNGSTDDTTAVQAAIDAAASAGGGVVYFPRGVYVIGGALQDTSRSNSQLLLPRIDYVDTEQITIELRGEFAPPPIMSVVGATTIPDGHSIIKGTLNTASGTAPSLIGAWGPSGTYLNFTNLHIVVRDLAFRMPSNPQLTACNFQNVACVDVDRVVVDCGGYYVQGLTEPTTAASVGMRLPATLNGANTRLGTVDVIGFYTGYLFAEHTVGENVKAWGCKIAATFAAADHASYFTRFMAVHCEKVLTATGEHYVDFGQLDIEHATTGWWVTDYDIDDINNYLNGDSAWHVVLADTGVDDTFTVNGAVNMRRKRIGKWFYYQLTDAATIAIPAQITSDFKVTLGGNRTLGNPTGMQDGQVFSIRIRQDATGTRTLAFGSKWKLIGTAPTLSTAANARWYLSGQYDSNDDTINYTIQNVAA
jgi:hypothetical protein